MAFKSSAPEVRRVPEVKQHQAGVPNVAPHVKLRPELKTPVRAGSYVMYCLGVGVSVPARVETVMSNGHLHLRYLGAGSSAMTIPDVYEGDNLTPHTWFRG